MIKGWRTVAIAAAVGAVGAVQALDWATLVNEETVPWVLMVLSGVMLVLRKLTNTPVGKSE